MNDVVDAFVELLDDFLVDVGKVPAGGGWQGAPGASQFAAYLVVHPGTGTADGSIAETDRQIDRDFQVTCVAANGRAAERLGTLVAQTLSGKRITTDTRVTTRPISVRRWGALDTDDTVQPPVSMVAHVFSVDTVPA